MVLSHPRPFALRGGRFRSKACTFPAHSEEWTSVQFPCEGTEHLVSVLDLDNVIVGSCEPPQPHLVAANNADYLSERCKMVPKNRVRQDEKEAGFFLIMSKISGGA